MGTAPTFGTLTVYMKEPGPGTVGHLWVSLEQNGLPAQHFGFHAKTYPGTTEAILGVPGVVRQDDNITYSSPDKAIQLPIAKIQYDAALEFCLAAVNQELFGEYQLLANACVDFAWAVVKKAGISVSGLFSALVEEDGALMPAQNSTLMDQTVAEYTAGNYAFSLPTHGLSLPTPKDSIFSNHVAYSGVSDNITGGLQDNVIWALGGDDIVQGGTGNEKVYGGVGIDIIDGASGTDYLYGEAGDDWLGYTAASPTAGSLTERDSDGNYYEGGTGTDHIFGSVNADRIRFSQGDGTDIVTGNGGADILEYVANGGFLATSREGKNLVLSRTHVNGAVDRIVMQNWYADIPAESMRLDRVDFGAIDPTTGLFVASGSLNGDILHEQGLHKQIGATAQELRGDLVAYQETLQGSDRADWLYSSQAVDENSVGDILVGGIGDDYLYGSIGADKVRIGAGDGKDVFRGNGGADIVETYGGINITHTYTKLDKVGADLRATFIDGTQLTIRDWDVESKLMAFREGRDGSLVGYDWVNQNLDNFYGDAGVNVITGNALANELYGYGGADRLVGGGGNDQFWGGTGNDELIGGTGNDAFYFGFDDGVDHIWGGGGGDVLNFQASGQGHPLTASRVGNDIKFSYSASDSVTVHDWFSNAGAAMTVNLPNGQVMSSSQVNAGFNTTALGWTGGVYNSQDFLAVLYSLNSNFKILDDQYKATWGKSFYAQAFNSMVKNYYNDTGVDINGSSVYSWGAGMGNQYATPGTILYGDVWWDFWSNGNGGHNFVITQANAGHVTSGWSYDSGNPGGINAFPEVVKVSDFYYSNPMQAMPSTRDSFIVYDGSYAQASAMGVYNVSSTSTQSFSAEEDAGGYSYSTPGSGEAAELVGVSNAQMMYLA